MLSIPEITISKTFKSDNIDSLAIYYRKNWLIATAKSTNKLIIFNKKSLKFIKYFGGDKIFNRPNGIAVVDDLCFIVERDGKRIQVFELPSFKFKSKMNGIFFKRPYGISIHRLKSEIFNLYITDNEKEFGNVHLIKYNRGIFKPKARFGRNTFKKLESIKCDEKYGRLFIADEQTKKIHVYGLNGKKQYVLYSSFINDPEGIDIFKNYIIATEQTPYSLTKFHVFNRNTMKHLGIFKGKLVKNTDGIVIDTKTGKLYVVDDDKRICCFDFEKIITSFNPLRI